MPLDLVAETTSPARSAATSAANRATRSIPVRVKIGFLDRAFFWPSGVDPASGLAVLSFDVLADYDDIQAAGVSQR